MTTTDTTDKYSCLDDVLKDEIRRSFEAVENMQHYKELYEQLTAYVKEQYDGMYKLLAQEIKDHFCEYDVYMREHAIEVSGYRVSYLITPSGEWSLHEIDASDCTSASDVEELASRAQSVEDDLDDEAILDKVRLYFEMRPSRTR